MPIIDNATITTRKKIWEDSLKLGGYETLIDSSLAELNEYFNLDRNTVEKIFYESKKLLAEEWNSQNISKQDQKDIINFYNKTQFEIFELMQWHTVGIDNGETGPLNYVCALEIAKKIEAKRYLDFGAGIGSGGILFLKNGFDVTLADVSDSLLNFLKFRLKTRNLNCCLMDLKKLELPNGFFDIITCFDVIEHTLNPLEIIKKLRDSLKRNGILIVNNTDIKYSPDKPMHIFVNKDISPHLRSLGFTQLWSLQTEFRRSHNGYVTVLKKNDFSSTMNALVYWYDAHCPFFFKKFINKQKNKYKKCLFQ